MNIKNLILFVGAFIVFATGLHGLNYYLGQNQKKIERGQNEIILDKIIYRFGTFLDLQTTIGTIGSEQFSQGDLRKIDYGTLSEKLLNINKQIFGLNIVDKTGEIIRIFPEEQNKKALGLKTQHYEELIESHKKGEPFWFSPPVKLLQGDLGFIMYFPILNGKDLKGWYAVVVKTEGFKKNFDLQKFLSSYHLVIQDESTKGEYYATGIPPESEENLLYYPEKFYGRTLRFISWKKDTSEKVAIPVTWIYFGSLFLSYLVVLVFKFYSQKKKARRQLDDISILLNLTSKEAVSKLIDLQKEMYKVGNPDNVRYITNLIEQIDLLKSTAQSRQSLDQTEVDVFKVLLSELEEARELLEKKEIQLHFIPEKFANMITKTNQWLFKNTVVGSILSYAIVNSDHGSALTIECQRNSIKNIITIHSQRLYHFDSEGDFANLNRRIQVAKKVLNISGGDLQTTQDLAGGMLIRIELKNAVK